MFFRDIKTIHRYNQTMADRVIHISEAGAASNFAGLLARVREGAEIVGGGSI
jgi:hypothetical protein